MYAPLDEAEAVAKLRIVRSLFDELSIDVERRFGMTLKPYRALARTVRAKIRQAALDTKGSFRDGDAIPNYRHVKA